MSRFIGLGLMGLLLTLGLSFSAHAQIDPPHQRNELANSTDIFGTLLSWYVAGTPIAYEQASGYFTGRCYYVNQRNQPHNTLLGVVQKRIPNNNGPAFPDTFIRKMVEVGVAGQHESYFDNYPASTAQWDIDRAEKHYAEIEDVGGTMVSLLNVATPTSFGLRVSGQYYVTAYSAIQTGTFYPRGQSVGLPVMAGQIWLTCYYFKRLI